MRARSPLSSLQAKLLRPASSCLSARHRPQCHCTNQCIFPVAGVYSSRCSFSVEASPSGMLQDMQDLKRLYYWKRDRGSISPQYDDMLKHCAHCGDWMSAVRLLQGMKAYDKVDISVSQVQCLINAALVHTTKKPILYVPNFWLVKVQPRMFPKSLTPIRKFVCNLEAPSWTQEDWGHICMSLMRLSASCRDYRDILVYSKLGERHGVHFSDDELLEIADFLKEPMGLFEDKIHRVLDLYLERGIWHTNLERLLDLVVIGENMEEFYTKMAGNDLATQSLLAVGSRRVPGRTKEFADRILSSDNVSTGTANALIEAHLNSNNLDECRELCISLASQSLPGQAKADLRTLELTARLCTRTHDVTTLRQIDEVREALQLQPTFAYAAALAHAFASLGGRREAELLVEPHLDDPALVQDVSAAVAMARTLHRIRGPKSSLDLLDLVTGRDASPSTDNSQTPPMPLAPTDPYGPLPKELVEAHMAYLEAQQAMGGADGVLSHYERYCVPYPALATDLGVAGLVARACVHKMRTLDVCCLLGVKPMSLPAKVRRHHSLTPAEYPQCAPNVDEIPAVAELSIQMKQKRLALHLVLQYMKMDLFLPIKLAEVGASAAFGLLRYDDVLLIKSHVDGQGSEIPANLQKLFDKGLEKKRALVGSPFSPRPLKIKTTETVDQVESSNEASELRFEK